MKPGQAPGRSPAAAQPLTGVSLVRSPCTSVCKIDAATGWCEGCRRSLDEIAGWSAMDDAAKLAVWRLLRERRLQAGTPQVPTPPMAKG